MTWQDLEHNGTLSIWRTASYGPAIFRCLLLPASSGLPSRPLQRAPCPSVRPLFPLAPSPLVTFAISRSCSSAQCSSPRDKGSFAAVRRSQWFCKQGMQVHDDPLIRAFFANQSPWDLIQDGMEMFRGSILGLHGEKQSLPAQEPTLVPRAELCSSYPCAVSSSHTSGS